MKPKLDQENPVYLYLQLSDLLRKQVAKLPDGHRFHTDREICRLFKVSQPTARSALAILVKERLLKRISSRGTFVQKGAGNTIKRKSMAIGVISPLESDYPHVLGIKGIENVAGKYGYHIILSDFGLNEESNEIAGYEKLPELVESLKRRKVDGIVIISLFKKEDYEAPQCLQTPDVPFVLINWSITKPAISSVIADYEDGAYKAVLHLLDLGYKTIGFIGGPKDRKANIDRFNGYKKALAERKIEYKPEFVYPENPDFDEKSGYETTTKILRLKELPRAIFAVTDALALGALNAIKDSGLKVPEDIALVGFDNLPLSTHTRPTLTSVTQPYYELGVNAMTLLQEKIAGNNNYPVKMLIPCNLVIRESCGYSDKNGAKNG
ncbi:MAG: GntR family transcriptional regulator [Candidatus Omnitrophota bacterium]